MKNLKSFFAGVLVTILIIMLATTVFAEQISKTINVVYRDIKITIDGEEITPKDANGKIVEPFIFDGTTYLPVRAISEAVGYDVGWDDVNNTVMLREKQAEAGEFYSAIFALNHGENDLKIGIPSIFMRFYGIQTYINTDDFTDMVLTRDGIPVDNKLTYTGVFHQGEWWIGEITDFYFAFEYENLEPGRYGFTGKYKGVPFEVYNKIIEASPLGDTPANPDYLCYVSWVSSGLYGREGAYALSSIGFNFHGTQQTFYKSDLTDLKLTLNGEEIEFMLLDSYSRYLECFGDEVQTGFHWHFEKPFTTPGIYQMTGNYMGKPFASEIIEILVP